MVCSFTFVRLAPVPLPAQILVVVGFALIVHWIQRRTSFAQKAGRRFALCFLLIQGLVIGWYVLYLLRVPPSIFYLTWPTSLRTLVTFVINATFALPFGKYIDQLDGIYWALCAEVLFYILYPIIIVPLLERITLMNRWRKVLLGLFLFPFCFGLYLIGQRLLGLSMLQIHLMIYFVSGVIIGKKYGFITTTLAHYRWLFSHPLWVVGMLLVVFGSIYIPTANTPWYQIGLALLMVLPVSMLLVTAIIPHEGKTLLKWPFFVYLGKYSYAIFLTHSVVIHAITSYIHSTSSWDAVRIVVLSLALTFGLAYILYELTERTYFASTKKAVVLTQHFPMKSHITTAIGFGLSILILLYFAYKAPVSFFTSVYRQGGSNVWSGNAQKSITLSDKLFQIPLVAQQNNLGMILTHVKNEHIAGMTTGFVPFLLIVRLRDEKLNLISESTYHAYEIIDDLYHPFGFPPIANSQGKKYTVEYQLSEKSLADEIKLITDEADLLTVYFIDKKSLVREPTQLFPWAINKVVEPLSNSMHWVTLAYVSPFLVLLFWSLYNTQLPRWVKRAKNFKENN